MNSIDAGLSNFKAPFSKSLVLMATMAFGVELAIQFDPTLAIAGMVSFSFLWVSVARPGGWARFLRFGFPLFGSLRLGTRNIARMWAQVLTRLQNRKNDFLARSISDLGQRIVPGDEQRTISNNGECGSIEQ